MEEGEPAAKKMRIEESGASAQQSSPVHVAISQPLPAAAPVALEAVSSKPSASSAASSSSSSSEALGPSEVTAEGDHPFLWDPIPCPSIDCSQYNYPKNRPVRVYGAFALVLTSVLL